MLPASANPLGLSDYPPTPSALRVQATSYTRVGRPGGRWSRSSSRIRPWSLLRLKEYPPAPLHARDDAAACDGVSQSRSLLSLVPAAPRLPQRARAARRAVTLSLIVHAAVLTVLMSAAAWSGARPARLPIATPTNVRLQLPRIVFLQLHRPGGGGGGGGNRQSNPPSRAQAPGRDRVTIPVAKPLVAREQPTDVMPPPQQVVLDAKPLASGTTLLAGLPQAPASLPFSQGPGFGGGVGEGTGSGVGSGTGPGVGPGFGGGFGGGAYRLGSGVVPPTVLKEVKPKYTAEAMRQRIQGTVGLEVVVSRDGIPVALRVTRSLDPGGLDEEAIVAARQWRFTPGRVGDTPVDVLVTILLDFNVR